MLLLILLAASQEQATQPVLLNYLPLILSGLSSVLVGLGLYSLNSKIEISIQQKLEEYGRANAAKLAATEDTNRRTLAAAEMAHATEMEKMLVLLEAHRHDMERMMQKLNALAAISLKDDKEGLVRFFLNAPNSQS